MPTTAPPNILFVITDQHAPQTMGCMGADFAITPNMDRLAARGVLFENAYCNYAICVPSRASCMTGLLPHRIRAFDNGSPIPSGTPTFAHMLSARGYRTVLDGKMHFVGAADQLHGYQEHWLESADQVWSCRWGEEAAGPAGYREWAEVEIVPDDEFAAVPVPRDATPEDCRGLPNGRYHMIDADRHREALAFLAQAPNAAHPWMLTVGYLFPHYPLICTQSAWDAYEGVDIPPPRPPGELHPRNRRWSDDVWHFDRMTAEEHRAARRVYMAMVTMVDAWLGELMDALDRHGLADNTVVVFASDHGEMAGHRGMWGKSLFYEDSSRVPLIVSAPALGVDQGRRIATPVSLVDLYPTLRDVAGIDDWHADLDGRSLWDACRGGALGDEPVYCEYHGSETIGPERMARLGRHKLNYYHNQGIELFDLDADPDETVDLADDPAHANVRKRLLDIALRDWDPVALDAEVRADQNRRCLVREASNAPPGAWEVGRQEETT